MCIAGTELNLSSTADIYFLSNYYNSSVLDNSSIVFKVKGERGAKMFMLSHKKSFAALFYNIVIDGWSNVKSAIRKRSSYEVVSDDYGPPLNKAYFKPFCVSWQSNLIQTGRVSVIDTDVCLSVKDECMIAVYDIGIVGTNNNATWLFNMTSCKY
jgi:hypothetical protein